MTHDLLKRHALLGFVTEQLKKEWLVVRLATQVPQHTPLIRSLASCEISGGNLRSTRMMRL